MAQYTGVNNGGEDVFYGWCGGYITSMEPVPNSNNNRETTEKSAEAVQFEAVPDKKCVRL
jgi:hypothetical protein